MAEIKRMRYFKEEFLKNEDFIDEQEYHRRMRYRHNKDFHTWGIGDGLEVTFTPGDHRVDISPGIAIDGDGREIIIEEPRILDFSKAGYEGGESYYITITWSQEEGEPRQENVAKRWVERPGINTSKTPPARPELALVLARVTLNPDRTIAAIDNSGRHYAQVRIQDGTVTEAKLADNAVTSSKIMDGSVITPKLANNAVTETKIADQAVSEVKIADDSVTSLKIKEADGTTGQDPNQGAGIKTGHLQDGAVTGVKITDKAVTRAKIGDGSVNEDKISTSVQAQLVTNGDSHDHSGGDGAQIKHSSLNKNDGSNPHSTTANDVGALSLAEGGTVEGEVKINNDVKIYREGEPLGGILQVTGGVEVYNKPLEKGLTGYINLGKIGEDNSISNFWHLQHRAGELYNNKFFIYHVDPINNNWTHTFTITPQGLVGIGTTDPQKRLHIRGANGGPVLDDGQDRPALSITGSFPELDLFSATDNQVHGPTIRLGSYNDDTRATYKHWSIGTSGRNSRFLDIGFSNNQDAVYAGIRNHSGNTVMTLLENGNVGINKLEPEGALHVKGHNATAYFESDGNEAHLILRTIEGAANHVHIVNRPGGRAAIRAPRNDRPEDAFNVLANGNVGVRTEVPDSTLSVVAGRAVDFPLDGNQIAAAFYGSPGSNGRPIVVVNRGNKGEDGVNYGPLISFLFHGGDVGRITVNENGALSYLPFTGSHLGWSKETLEQNILVSMTGNNKTMIKDVPESEPLYGVAVTKTKNDKKVLGTVFSTEEGQILVAAVGNHFIWAADKGKDIEAGDSLISSDVAGHAEKDPEEDKYSYVIGRASENVKWDEVEDTIEIEGKKIKHKLISVLFGFHKSRNS